MEIKDYSNIFISLKQHIKLSQQKTVLIVNAQLLFLYWEIGNFIIQRKEELGWGAKVVKQLSKDLRIEFPEMKGFSERNIRSMVRFAEVYSMDSIWQTVSAKLEKNDKNAIWQTLSAKLEKNDEIASQALDFPTLLENSISIYEFLQHPISKVTWSHNLALIDKTKNANERNYYLERTISEGWSYRVLIHKIEQKLYESQGQIINNFDNTLPPLQSELAKQTLKDKYIFDFLSLGKEAKEREIENALLKEITSFLLELGKGFAFLGQQYHLKVGEKDFYVDLLFFHTELNCYFIIELKIEEFKPEFAGKLEFYINVVDDKLKQKNHNNTIGLLLCKSANKVVVEYTLKNKNEAIGVSTYKLLPSKKKLEAILKKHSIQKEKKQKKK